MERLPFTRIYMGTLCPSWQCSWYSSRLPLVPSAPYRLAYSIATVRCLKPYAARIVSVLSALFAMSSLVSALMRWLEYYSAFQRWFILFRFKRCFLLFSATYAMLDLLYRTSCDDYSDQLYSAPDAMISNSACNRWFRIPLVMRCFLLPLITRCYFPHRDAMIIISDTLPTSILVTPESFVFVCSVVSSSATSLWRPLLWHMFLPLQHLSS